MKTIIVPTDFSKCSENAIHIAQDLAKKFDSKLIFLHVMSIPVDWVKLETGQGNMYPEVTKKVDAANYSLSHYVDLAQKEGLKADFQLIYHESYMGIIEFIKDMEESMVVMGTHGATGAKEFFMGSVTQKIVRHSNLPVLVVKECTDKLKFHDMAFVSDFDHYPEKGFYDIMQFARVIGLRVHLLYINTPDTFMSSIEIHRNMERYEAGNEDIIESGQIYNAYVFEDGLMDYVKNNNIDLISMLTHTRKGMSRLVSGSLTEKIVNHADEPVLSMHYE